MDMPIFRQIIVNAIMPLLYYSNTRDLMHWYLTHIIKMQNY